MSVISFIVDLKERLRWELREASAESWLMDCYRIFFSGIFKSSNRLDDKKFAFIASEFDHRLLLFGFFFFLSPQSTAAAAISTRFSLEWKHLQDLAIGLFSLLYETIRKAHTDDLCVGSATECWTYSTIRVRPHGSLASIILRAVVRNWWWKKLSSSLFKIEIDMHSYRECILLAI